MLHAYDEQLRARAPAALPSGAYVEREGPILRLLGFAGRGWVLYRDLGGADGDELDELIAREVRVFPRRDQA